MGESFTVPAGVSSLGVTRYGATGGDTYNPDTAVGAGAKVTADLAVTAGQTLGVDVGGAGGGGQSVNHAGGTNGVGPPCTPGPAAGRPT